MACQKAHQQQGPRSQASHDGRRRRVAISQAAVRVRQAQLQIPRILTNIIIPLFEAEFLEERRLSNGTSHLHGAAPKRDCRGQCPLHQRCAPTQPPSFVRHSELVDDERGLGVLRDSVDAEAAHGEDDRVDEQGQVPLAGCQVSASEGRVEALPAQRLRLPDQLLELALARHVGEQLDLLELRRSGRGLEALGAGEGLWCGLPLRSHRSKVPRLLLLTMLNGLQNGRGECAAQHL
mmetsp:Transcript_114991/g.365367  ORF Transcript_114991/g.365367 Transcript_114991/m.365367 type:complete len:235 (+) Transcript_114991:406-1110(+)